MSLASAHIGQRIAKLLRQGYESEVLYHSRSRKPEVEKNLGLIFKSLNDIFSRCDALIVAVSYAPETKDLITAQNWGNDQEKSHFDQCCQSLCDQTQAI